MKPIRLRMTAFGPYPQEEIIDFETLNGRYLFLITGPTGSGKTTLFDAMSYAIYGESSGSMRPSDSFRSQFALEEELTTVTFTFELHNERYEVERIPKQLRPKSVGEGYTEQKPEATLRFLSQNKRPISGVTQVTKTLEDLIGLSEEQFKQIMMIPQGEFRQLLVATSEEREKVLKRLFDTSVYRQIQEVLVKRAATLYGSIKEGTTQRDALMGTLEWNHFYEEAEWDDLQQQPVIQQIEDFFIKMEEEKQRIKEAKKTVEHLQETLVQLKKDRDRQETVNQKFDQLDRLREEQVSMDKEKESVIQLERAVEKAQKALTVKPYEKAWKDRRGDYDDDEKAQKSSEEQLTLYEEALQKEKEIYDKEYSQDAEEELQALSVAIEQWDELVAAAGQLQQLKVTTQQIINDAVSSQKALVRQEALIEEQKHGKEKLEQLKNRHIELQLKKDRELDGFDRLKQQEEELARYEEAFKKLSNYERAYRKLEKAIKANQENLRVKRDAYKTMRRDFMNQQGAIFAKELEEGMPCPVCGSVHHPNPAQKGSGDLTIEVIEEEENRLNQFDKQLNEQMAQQARLETRIQQQKEYDEGFRRFCISKEVHWQQGEGENPLEVCAQLRSVLEGEKETRTKALKALETEKEALDKEKKQLESITKDLSDNVKALENMAKIYEQQREKRFKLEAQLEQVEEANHRLRRKMRVDEDVLLEELQQLKEQVATAFEKRMNERERIDKAYESTMKNRDTEKIRVQQLMKQVQRSKEKMLQAYEYYETIRQEQGFESEVNYREALLEEQQLVDYKEHIHTFYERLQGLLNASHVIEKELKGHERKELEPLKLRIQNLEEETQDQMRAYTLMGDRLNRSLNTLTKVRECHRSIEEKETVYKRVGFLANYAQGKNPAMLSFERFALAAFLEDILEAANNRLKYMTDGRYQMKRSQKLERKNRQSGLDIEIYDYYSGMSRSIKTLSGGESFKASLAMALGLSDVVQSYAGGVRMDTMFIDEGFGTLDQESLDSAIACLSQLKESGRLVGIISHVQELKERIPTQLRVQVGQRGSYTEFVVND